MPKPQDHGGDEAAEIDEDLKLLNEMNIDEDFNVWSDFRKSFCRNGQKESIRSLVTKSQRRASRTFSDESLDLDGIGEEIEDEVKQSLEVSFSTLTPGEQREYLLYDLFLLNARNICFIDLILHLHVSFCR